MINFPLNNEYFKLFVNTLQKHHVLQLARQILLYPSPMRKPSLEVYVIFQGHSTESMCKALNTLVPIFFPASSLIA